jgi:hypothetical protein
MGKLANLLWCVSALSCVYLVCDNVLAKVPVRLTDGHQHGSSSDLLASQEAVTSWLRAHKRHANQKLAAGAYEDGKKSMKQRDWGAATKHLGESAILYPAPGTLILYGDAHTQFISMVRARNKDSTQGNTDLSYALAVYKTARAANSELKSLSEKQLASLEADIACTETFLSKYPKATDSVSAIKSAAQIKDCRPLVLYAKK